MLCDFFFFLAIFYSVSSHLFIFLWYTYFYRVRYKSFHFVFSFFFFFVQLVLFVSQWCSFRVFPCLPFLFFLSPCIAWLTIFGTKFLILLFHIVLYLFFPLFFLSVIIQVKFLIAIFLWFHHSLQSRHFPSCLAFFFNFTLLQNTFASLISVVIFSYIFISISASPFVEISSPRSIPSL